MTLEWPEDEYATTPRLSPFTVVTPTRLPWLPVAPLPVHVAKSVTVAFGPGLVRAADTNRKPLRSASLPISDRLPRRRVRFSLGSRDA